MENGILEHNPNAYVTINIGGPSAACISVAVVIGVCFIAKCLIDADYSIHAGPIAFTKKQPVSALASPAE